MALSGLADGAAFARWFGAYTSLPKYADADWQPEAAVGQAVVQALIASSQPLARNPASRFAFIRQGEGALFLFVDGQSFDCTGDAARVAEQICASTSLTLGPALSASPAVVILVAALIDQGSLAFDEDER